MTDHGALRAYVEGLPPGFPVTLPRETVLELLEGPLTGELPPSDHTAAQLAQRWGRKAGTVRGWCEQGRIPGAYRFNGREWRVPLAAVLQFEASQQDVEKPAPSHDPEPGGLGAWRHHTKKAS